MADALVLRRTCVKPACLSKGRNLRPCALFEVSAHTRTVTGMHVIHQFRDGRSDRLASQLLYRSSLGRNQDDVA